MAQIRTLAELESAVQRGKALVIKGQFFNKDRIAAAFVYNMSTKKVHGFIKAGMFTYEKPKKSKEPEKKDAA